MRSLIFVLVFVHLCVAQHGDLNCRYLRTRVANQNVYICMLSRQYIDPAAQTFTISGEHQSRNTDESVRGILITDCEVPVLSKALMSHLYKKFPLIVNLEVFHSRLQTIEPGVFDLPEASENMMNIHILFNNITVIENGAFDGLRKLDVLKIVSSRVETIEQGAFSHLEKLRKLTLQHNNLKQLPVKLFHAMYLLFYIDISDNQLQIIDGDIFYFNSEIDYIDLSFNEISAIGENIFAGMHQFTDIFIYKNRCVDGTFRFREAAMRALQECFEKYGH